MKLLLASAILAVLAISATVPAAAQCRTPNKSVGIASFPNVTTPPTSTGFGHGVVALRVDVAADGSVTGHEFLQHGGNQQLDIAAVRTVMQAKYTPAMENCKAVPGSYLFIVDYPLERVK